MTVHHEYSDQHPIYDDRERSSSLDDLLGNESLDEDLYLLDYGKSEQPLNGHGDDRVLADRYEGTFAVADGMGSYNGSDQAATSIVNSLNAGLRNSRFEDVNSMKEAVAVMKQAFVDSQSSVKRLVDGDVSIDRQAGAVASAVKILSFGGQIYGVYGHVGDTRIAIRHANGEIRQITKDECLPPPESNVVLHSINSNPDNMAFDQFGFIELQYGDRLAILSDGVTGDAEQDKLTSNEWEIAFAAPDAKKSADTFTKLAKKIDDRSAVVVDIESYVEPLRESKPRRRSAKLRAAAVLGGLAAATAVAKAKLNPRKSGRNQWLVSDTESKPTTNKTRDKLRHISRHPLGYVGMAMAGARASAKPSPANGNGENRLAGNEDNRRKTIKRVAGAVALLAAGYLVYKGIDALLDVPAGKNVGYGPTPNGNGNAFESLPSPVEVVPDEVSLPAYNSQTGAGTVEGSALEQVRLLGIDTSDLTDLQNERFTNLLRTETLELNDLTEAQARRLQVGRMIDMLQQVEIERLLEISKSR